jgi:hypothetical protein
MTAQILRDEPDSPSNRATFLRALAAGYGPESFVAYQLRKAADEYEAMQSALRDLQVIAEGHVEDLSEEVKYGGATYSLPVALMEIARWSAVIDAFQKSEGI